MRHLQSDELIDLAEGTRPEASAPHLQACDSCRRQLGELRAMMTAAADAGVPEPSPLFWDHFSARVRGAVDAEGAPRRAVWLDLSTWVRLPLAIAAVAVVVIAAAVTLRVGHAPLVGGTPPVMFPSGGDSAMWADDASLDMVADLAAQTDWDVTTAPGLETHEDAADKAIGQLNAGERRELQRLLNEELARRGDAGN